MKFEEKLIRLRKARGLSQEELAKALDVSRQAVSRWELGTTLPDVPNLVKLCDLFQVSADELIREGGLPSSTPEPQAASESAVPPPQGDEAKARRYLICAILWTISGVCMLIGAILSFNILHVLCVFLDAGLALYNTWLYEKHRPKAPERKVN